MWKQLVLVIMVKKTINFEIAKIVQTTKFDEIVYHFEWKCCILIFRKSNTLELYVTSNVDALYVTPLQHHVSVGG